MKTTAVATGQIREDYLGRYRVLEPHGFKPAWWILRPTQGIQWLPEEMIAEHALIANDGVISAS